MQVKWVYDFAEGNAAMKALLGAKGANLAEMVHAGLPVPYGFTVTTEACAAYFRHGCILPEDMLSQIREAMARLEAAAGRRFGDASCPLLVSVRSGAAVSMPGMMDTILNVGLNDVTVRGLAQLTGDERFAYDCYRRLIQMYGEVVLGVKAKGFEAILEKKKRELRIEDERKLSAQALREIAASYKELVRSETGEPFPQNAEEQLVRAVEAVFRSWNSPRAKVYREAHGIDDQAGTAANVQCMVFGNMGDDCGTGVVFTRNPSTGERGLFGEFLQNAQGEDIVAGIRTPQDIRVMKEIMPEAYAELKKVCETLEAHYKDMQDIEFTVERNKLYVLQTRSGKRNARAALKIAVDLVEEGVIDRKEALLRIDPAHLDQLMHRAVDETASFEVLATGLPASPGAAAGRAVFDADRAAAWKKAGEAVILVRNETAPEDIHGVIASAGILTARGGLTSHAAVVARGMGKPCVCGCEAIRIDLKARRMMIGSRVIEEGDWITLDGGSGRVMAGAVPLKEAAMTEELRTVLAWADEFRKLRVYANADTPEDARLSRSLGAEGIGLCRTEHMFFPPARLAVMQSVILADTEEERKAALDRLLPLQQADFEGIFEAMDGLPVTIRLLDPPLHEFLPRPKELMKKLSAAADTEEAERLEKMLRKIEALREENPMLGNRGCRLGIVHPEIYDMQIEAIFRAALACLDRGISVRPHIMIPLVGDAAELKHLRGLVDRVAEQVLPPERRGECRYKVGTMIEVPRAALTAGAIAQYAEFFSFGTNDLTQMTFGYSRDDAESKFLPIYLSKKLLRANPFEVLDEEGVGKLIEIAVALGKGRRPALSAGICGEHGGERRSIALCHRYGLDSVSCSPYRVPAARIAAAQAAIEHEAALKECAEEGRRAV